jgi:hypothetical protein
MRHPRASTLWYRVVTHRSIAGMNQMGSRLAGLRWWDTRVVFIESKGRWWWNAWRARTATELYGFADTQEAARHAMFEAISRAPEYFGDEEWVGPAT